jgi:hypothetical protein
VTQTQSYLDRTRLVEEVPGVPENERYFLWHEHKVAAHFSTKAEGEEYAAANGINIEVFEAFEP